MTSVRISVQSEDGDVSVEEEFRTVRFDVDERERISQLLRKAVDKIGLVYGLSQKRGVEAPKNPEAGS